MVAMNGGTFKLVGPKKNNRNYNLAIIVCKGSCYMQNRLKSEEKISLDFFTHCNWSRQALSQANQLFARPLLCLALLQGQPLHATPETLNYIAN